MSNIHLIITQNKIEFLPKDRYLKFDEYGCINGLFIYTRYARNLGMIELLNNRCYLISSNGIKLLGKILSGGNDLYWSTVQLENHIGEEVTSIKYLNLIQNKQFTKIPALDNQELHINTLYYLESLLPNC